MNITYTSIDPSGKEEEMTLQRRICFYERWKDNLPMYNLDDEEDDYPQIPTMVIAWSSDLEKRVQQNWQSFDGLQNIYATRDSQLFFQAEKKKHTARFLGCFDESLKNQIPERIVCPEFIECIVEL